MIRKFTALVALLFALGMAVAPAAAQDFDLGDAEELGLEGIYGRLYLTEAALTGEPGVMGVMIVGVSFSDADSAARAFEPVTCGFAGGMFGLEDEGNCEALTAAGVEVADIDGIGDQAIELLGEEASEDPMPILVLATQSDNHIFLVIYMGADESGLADDFAIVLAEAESSDTDVEFDADGAGSGGFFDMLPDDSDPVVEGLIPFQDIDITSEMNELQD